MLFQWDHRLHPESFQLQLTDGRSLGWAAFHEGGPSLLGNVLRILKEGEVVWDREGRIDRLGQV